MKWLAALLMAVTAAAASHEWVQQANQALEDENFTLAAELLEKVLAESPDDHETRFQLAYAYTRLEEHDKAIEGYRQVVETKPDLIAAQVNLSMLLMQNGSAQEALPHLQAVTEARPDDTRFRLFLAQALLDARRFDDAVPAFERALELDPSSADAALGMGQSLEQSGRFAEAAQAYRKGQPSIRRSQTCCSDWPRRWKNAAMSIKLCRFMASTSRQTALRFTSVSVSASC